MTLKFSTHASDVSTSYGDDLALREVNLGVHVNAQCHGDLERVAFSVSTHGGGRVEDTPLSAGEPLTEDGSTETGHLDLEGEFRRVESPGGVLEITPSTAQIEDVGEFKFSGKILDVLGCDPGVDFTVELPSVDARALLSKLPSSLKAAWPVELASHKTGADLHARAHLTGSLSKPRADGSLEAVQLTIPCPPEGEWKGDFSCKWQGLTLNGSSALWSVEQLHGPAGGSR